MTKDKTPHLKETKDKETKDKETKDKDLKGKSNLVGRVKKVIKKSRRKLGEVKFEKELQRTIEFLAQLQVKLGNSHDGRDGREGLKTLGKVEKKSVKRAGKKVENKTARGAAKKAKPGKKRVGKTAGNGAGRRGRNAAPRSKDATPAAETVMALKAETPSMEQ